MKEYRHYMCDFGHQWTLFKDENAPECEEDCSCLEGHEAVTLIIQPAVDDVQIIFRPAGRVADRVTRQVIGRGRYYLVIFDMSGTQEKVSEKQHTWEEACQIAQRFDKRSFKWALEHWERMSP